MRLYDLSAELRAILDALDESLGEVTPELEARLDALDGELPAKVDATCAIVMELEAHAKATREEAQRMDRLAAQRERASKRLRDYVHRCLELSGQRKIEGTRFAASLRKNPPRVVLDVPDAEVPGEWAKERVVRSVDRAGIGAALRAGQELPGLAHLEQSERLEIR